MHNIDVDNPEYNCFVRLLLRFARCLIFPLFLEDEPFQQVLRKVALLVFTAMGAASWGKAPTMAILSAVDKDGGWTFSRIMQVVLSAHVVLHFDLFNYTYMRITRRCPDWVADFACFSATLVMVEITLIDPHTDMRSILIIISMLTAMCSTPRLPLHLLFQFAVYYFGYLRDYFQTEIPELKFDSLDTTPTLFEKIYLLLIYSVVPVWMGVGGMHIIVSGYVKRNEEQRQNRKMTVDAADSLLVFDVDGLGQVVEDYKDEVDEELRQSFCAIHENLKLFRPHVPQYLIESAVRRAKGGSDDDDDEGAVLSGSDSESITSPNGADSKRHRIRGFQSGDNFSDRMSRSSRSSRSSRVSRSSANGVEKTTSRANVAMSAPRPFINTDAFRGNLTTAYIDFTTKPGMQGFTQLAGLVDTLNTAASATKTSIHSLHGDALFASWNATSRIVNHAIYGCSFVHEVMAKVAPAASAYSVTGSLVQCACSAVFSGMKQSHLLLSGEGLSRHESQRQLAKEVQAFVVDDGVRTNADTYGTFAGFAVDAEGRLLYDFIAPKGNEANDEWMYQLQAASRENPWEAVTLALRASRGEQSAAEIATAIAGLHRASAEVQDRPSVQYLKRYLKKTDIPLP